MVNRHSQHKNKKKLLDTQKAKGMGKQERSDQNDNKNDFLAHAVGKEIKRYFGSLYM
jgi:hypothetical protein